MHRRVGGMVYQEKEKRAVNLLSEKKGLYGCVAVQPHPCKPNISWVKKEIEKGENK